MKAQIRYRGTRNWEVGKEYYLREYNGKPNEVHFLRVELVSFDTNPFGLFVKGQDGKILRVTRGDLFVEVKEQTGDYM